MWETFGYVEEASKASLVKKEERGREAVKEAEEEAEAESEGEAEQEAMEY